MLDDLQNPFGPNFPRTPTRRVLNAVGWREGDRVLDVGGAVNRLWVASVVCDLNYGCGSERNGVPFEPEPGVEYVEGSVEQLPFDDGEFDFVYCAQVLEHVADPVRAAAELRRVASRGFVEVPSRLGEMVIGNPTHRWIVDRDAGELVFRPRTWIEHPLDNPAYGMVFRDEVYRHRMEGDFRNVFNHQVCFGEEPLRCRVEQGPRGVDPDVPEVRARSHYAFARACLVGGCPAEFVLADAETACWDAPDAEPARLLLACCLAFTGSLARAVSLVADSAADIAKEIRHVAGGGPPKGWDVAQWVAELPPSLQVTSTARCLPVTMLVAGQDPDRRTAAAVAGLTQEWPDTRVVVLTSDPGFLSPVKSDRLELMQVPPGESLGESLQRGIAASPDGRISFIHGDNLPLPIHASSFSLSMMTSNAQAVWTSGSEERLSTLVVDSATARRACPLPATNDALGIADHLIQHAGEHTSPLAWATRAPRSGSSTEAGDSLTDIGESDASR